MPLSASISAVHDLCIGIFYFVYDYMCTCVHSVLLTFTLSMYNTGCVTICACMCAHYVCIVCVYICHIKHTHLRLVLIVITVQLLMLLLMCNDKMFLVL